LISGGDRAKGLLLAIAALAVSSGPARADSELRLAYPTSFGKIQAATFD
jgi:hypothetical protein